MDLWSQTLSYLAGETPYSKELQALAMAFQGAISVRKGPNKDGSMHFFHAFALTTIIGFGGGWFGFFWMGKPTPMITNGDVNVVACLIAFTVVNYTPRDLGYKMVTFLPVRLVITSFGQLFRCLGMMRFITTAFNEVNASPYYPIPVIGPVLYGTLLGNWGGFFLNGFHGYSQHGIPWPFQNGLVIGTFFHLFAHDVDGPLGKLLRLVVYSVIRREILGDLDDKKVAFLITSIFMQATGIIRLPEFLGPSFDLGTPFKGIIGKISHIIARRYRRVDPFPSFENDPASPTKPALSNYKGKARKRKKKKTA